MRYKVCRSPEVNLCILPVVDLNVLTHFLELCVVTRISLEEGFQTTSMFWVLWGFFFPYSEKIKDIKCSRMFKKVSLSVTNTVVKLFVNINR